MKEDGVGAMRNFFDSTGESIRQENTVEVERIKELAVNSDVTNVHFSVHDKQRIDMVLETFEKGPELVVQQTNDRLEVNVEIPRKRRIFRMKKQYSKLTIYLPEQFAERYEVKCSVGNVRMANLIAKQLEVKTGAGEMKLCTINAEYLKLESGAGNIQLRAINAGHLVATAGAGNIKGNACHGELTLESGAGNIECDVDGEDDLFMKSGAGNIYVHFQNPEQLNASIGATAGLGNVWTDLPVGIEKAGKFSSVLGKGERDMTFITGVGNIKLFKE